MKAHRENGQQFKSATSKPQARESIFPCKWTHWPKTWCLHLNYHVYTVGTKGGILYNDYVEGQGAKMPCVPSIAPSKPVNFAVPAAHSSPSNQQIVWKPPELTEEHWCLGIQPLMFAVELFIINLNCLLFIQNMTLRSFRLAAKNGEKEILHDPPSAFCLMVVFTWTLAREESAPICSRPHPCGYLHRRTTQGFTCKLTDRYPVECFIKACSVLWFQYCKLLLLPRLLKKPEQNTLNSEEDFQLADTERRRVQLLAMAANET